MKFLFVPDSFKGTLSSNEVCDVLERCARRNFDDLVIERIPVADGGEGTVDVFLSLGLGEKIKVRSHNSFMEEKEGYYLFDKESKTAIVELAVVAGLPEVYDRRDPTSTTTYGVGELIKDGVKRGAKKVIVALGGSSTNDGGVGLACALGAKFFDFDGYEFLPVGGSLSDIADIDVSGLEYLKDVEFSVMCDVDTVLTGDRSASAVYGPQKGASEADVLLLDKGLSRLSELWKDIYKRDFSTLKGGGAAGGAGAGISAFLGGKLESGIEIVLRLLDFEKKLQGCDCVFTGEGKFDEQSFMGKVINGVSSKTKEKGVKLVVIAGVVKGVSKADIESAGISAVYATNPNNLPFEEVRGRAREDLEKTADKVFQDLKNNII
ncbi:MAG: glycerate kinase [Clostridia bacterium]|nr:glycerate kinase [Clostridia bacterium]